MLIFNRQSAGARSRVPKTEYITILVLKKKKIGFLLITFYLYGILSRFLLIRNPEVLKFTTMCYTYMKYSILFLSLFCLNYF